MAIRNILVGSIAACALAGAAQAAFTVTYEAAGVQNSTAVFDKVGVETFNNRALGTSNFTTDFGTGGVITASYDGVAIQSADQYGGAGGTGRYAATYSTTGYTINLSTTNSNGVNYFGYWLSALDSGNQVSFYSGSNLVYSFSPGDVTALVGGKTAYFGNPNSAFAGQDSGEPFVFLNFFDTTGTFDRIVVTETRAGAGYESDNHTVGYFTAQSGTPVGSVPEPASWAMMIGGFGMVGGVLRSRRAKPTLA